MPCSNDGGSERLCVRASLMIFAIGGGGVSGANYGVVGRESTHVSLVRGEREEAVGDEANFKLETAPAVYDVWYLGWPMLVI